MSPQDLGAHLARTTPRLLTIVFLVMALLFTFTGFLTRSYRQERSGRARKQYLAGQEFSRLGRYGDAIVQYREALALSHDNIEYRQALALALFRLGRTRESEAYLIELTRQDPANSVANLMLARIYVERRDANAAALHYGRAIYGLWPQDPAANRIQARLELAELLASVGAAKQLEAELLQLANEVQDNTALKQRIGRLFLSARSPAHAADMFRDVLRTRTEDAAAYAGLGDAFFELRDGAIIISHRQGRSCSSTLGGWYVE